MKTFQGHINQAGSKTSAHRFSHSRITEYLLTPVLAPLMTNRLTVLIFTGVAALQVFLTALGVGGWQCPIKSVLGMPCPGCGLSSAMVLLIHREWHEAMVTHAFAPVFLVGFVLMLIVGVLPDRLQRHCVRRIAALERYTGFMPLLSISIIAYWMLRSVGLL